MRDEYELASIYASLDLLLYPTLADSQSLVCVESLCCGTPIVGFATGGVPEVVGHGFDGLLVPAHDGEELVHAAAHLLRDDKLRSRMGQEAAVSAAQRYNLDLFAQRYEKAYEEALHWGVPAQQTRLPLHAVPAIIKARLSWRSNGRAIRQRT